MNIVEKNHAKRKERRKLSAEDFTPSYLVNEILDKMEQYHPDIFTNPDKTFIDPACGNGNLLIEVLKRKLQYTNPVRAVSTIYGCDIFDNNIAECIIELYKEAQKIELSFDDKLKVVFWLFKNIVCVNTNTYPNGSIDFLEKADFKWELNKKQCEKVLEWLETLVANEKKTKKTDHDRHYSTKDYNIISVYIKNLTKKQVPNTIDQFIE